MCSRRLREKSPRLRLLLCFRHGWVSAAPRVVVVVLVV
jgi:hypothetical protein